MNVTRALLIACFALLVASCNKSDNTPGTAATSTWKVNGVSYTVNNYTKTGDMWYAYDSVGNGISFSFDSFPASDGAYAVVDRTATLVTRQVKVDVFGSSAGSTYFSTGNDHTSAVVTVIGTQLKITLPDTWVLKGGSSTDSVRVSATLLPL